MEREKVERCLEWLREKPSDYAGCAEMLGVGYLEFMEMRSLHLREFQEVEQEALNRIESEMMRLAMEGNYSAVKFVLQAKKGWSTTQKVVKGEEERRESNGYALKRLEDYYGGEDGAQILSRAPKWGVQ